MGYARTTRDKSPSQLKCRSAVCTYYFEDKDELLIYCVRQYKSDFVRNNFSSSQRAFSSPTKHSRLPFVTALLKRFAPQKPSFTVFGMTSKSGHVDKAFVPVHCRDPKNIDRNDEPRLHLDSRIQGTPLSSALTVLFGICCKAEPCGGHPRNLEKCPRGPLKPAAGIGRAMGHLPHKTGFTRHSQVPASSAFLAACRHLRGCCAPDPQFQLA